MEYNDDIQQKNTTGLPAEELSGGNMNAPVKKGDRVYRTMTEATPTIHRLLRHVRAKGLAWVPEPFGIEGDREVLSFVPGEVPHDMPAWIWNESTLTEIVRRIREWHDATADFNTTGAVWNFAADGKTDVICHNDFAPYNCVFIGERFSGLIDFDLCAPGSRLWDLGYTVYRFVPVMPPAPLGDEPEHSPFLLEETFRRLDFFLDAYAAGNAILRYSRQEGLEVCAKRVAAIAEWTARFADETGNDSLKANARMYRAHAEWIAVLAEKGGAFRG